MSDVYSRVTVRIDKNSEISDDGASREIVYNVRIPVGSGSKCKDVSMIATSTFMLLSAETLPGGEVLR